MQSESEVFARWAQDANLSWEVVNSKKEETEKYIHFTCFATSWLGVLLVTKKLKDEQDDVIKA